MKHIHSFENITYGTVVKVNIIDDDGKITIEANSGHTVNAVSFIRHLIFLAQCESHNRVETAEEHNKSDSIHQRLENELDKAWSSLLTYQEQLTKAK